MSLWAETEGSLGLASVRDPVPREDDRERQQDTGVLLWPPCVCRELYAYNFENGVWVEGGASFFPARP